MKTALALILTLVSPLAFAAVNLSIEGLVSFVIYIVIVELIFWAIWWFVNFVGVPGPFNKVIRVVLGLVALIIVVNLLLGLAGTPMFNLR